MEFVDFLSVEMSVKDLILSFAERCPDDPLTCCPNLEKRHAKDSKDHPLLVVR
jgi:hypothetical protein